MAASYKSIIDRVVKAADKAGWDTTYEHDKSMYQGRCVSFTFERREETEYGSRIHLDALMWNRDVGRLLDEIKCCAEDYSPSLEAYKRARDEEGYESGYPTYNLGMLYDDEEEKMDWLLNFSDDMRQELEHLTEDGDDECM